MGKIIGRERERENEGRQYVSEKLKRDQGLEKR